MSGDNYRACPKCIAKALEDKKKLTEKIKTSYGKISEEKYLKLVNELKSFTIPTERQTLREDYEIGIYEGVFRVHYNGGCSACDFFFKFEHEEKV